MGTLTEGSRVGSSMDAFEREKGKLEIKFQMSLIKLVTLLLERKGTTEPNVVYCKEDKSYNTHHSHPGQTYNLFSFDRVFCIGSHPRSRTLKCISFLFYLICTTTTPNSILSIVNLVHSFVCSQLYPSMSARAVKKLYLKDELRKNAEEVSSEGEDEETTIDNTSSGRSSRNVFDLVSRQISVLRADTSRSI